MSSEIPRVTPPAGRVRYRYPAWVLGILSAIVAGLWLLPDDWALRGLAMTSVYFGLVLAMLLVGPWFAFFSPWTRRTRLAVAAAGLSAIVALVASIRAVEFSGDMVPTLVFRWSPVRAELLERHRAAQQAGQAPAAAGIPAERLVLRPGDSPEYRGVARDGRVYSLGALGDLVCLEAATGKRLWAENILQLNGGAKNLIWGMSGSPLVVDDLVIVSPGAQCDVPAQPPASAVLALDAETGKVRWRAGAGRAAYSSPMLATLAGQPQVLVFDAAGLAAYRPDDGQALWQYPWTTINDINAAQPLVLPDDRVFITSELGGAVVAISPPAPAAAEASAGESDPSGPNSPWQVRELWHTNTMKCSYANPVYAEGYIYGLDRGILGCVDAQTGQRMWKSGRYGHGQLLLAGDVLVVLTEKGELALVQATPEKARELLLVQAIEGKTWNNPVLVDGRLYLRNHLEMACYELGPGDQQ